MFILPMHQSVHQLAVTGEVPRLRLQTWTRNPLSRKRESRESPIRFTKMHLVAPLTNIIIGQPYLLACLVNYHAQLTLFGQSYLDSPNF